MFAQDAHEDREVRGDVEIPGRPFQRVEAPAFDPPARGERRGVGEKLRADLRPPNDEGSQLACGISDRQIGHVRIGQRLGIRAEIVEIPQSEVGQRRGDRVAQRRQAR